MVKMNFLQWSDTWRSLWTGLGGASSKMSLLGNYCYHLPQTSGSKCLLFLGEKKGKESQLTETSGITQDNVQATCGQALDMGPTFSLP